MNIATDLEGTLTTGRTWKAVSAYLGQQGQGGAVRLFMATHLPGTIAAQTGIINRQEYANRWIIDMARLLAGCDAAELDRLADYVVLQVMWPQRRQDVLDELERHHLDGHRIILTSGTYLPIAQAFARRAGIVDVIGSELAMDGGRATGRLVGALNNGPPKAERLRQLLGSQALDLAYGDTMADAPMLELCRTPIAVYPDDPLRRLAVSRNWRTIPST